MRLSVTLSNAKSLKHLGMKSIKEEGGDVSDTNRYRFFANAQNDRGQLNDRKQGGRLKSRFSDRPLLWPHAPLGAVALATEGLKRSFI